MTLLAGKLTLHDVSDTERLVRRALNDALRESRATLSPADYDDALAELISVAWQLSLSFDPSRSSFSRYAYRVCKLRLVDWYRRNLPGGRSSIRPELVSFDAELRSDGRGDDAPAPELDRGLEQALASRQGDRDVDRATDLARAFGGVTRSRARALEVMDQGAARGATARAPRAREQEQLAA